MRKIKKEYYLIAILLIMFTFLTFFVVSGKTDLIDESFFNKVIKIENNFITGFLYVITSLASTIGVIVLLGVSALIFLKKKAFSDFKYVIANVSIGVILMQVLKLIIKRSRPSWKWIVQAGFSYPSGHTISAVLLYGTLSLLIYKKVNGKVRKPLLIGFTLMIILTGFSRIYFGAHYLSDVLASFILGSVILIISNQFMNKEFSNDKNKDRKAIQTK